jgi:hypothetical protein
VENAQRQLWHQPPSATFDQLARRLPELRRLDQRPRTDRTSFLRELSPIERLLGGLGVKGQRFRIALGLQKAVRRLVGPAAGFSDPVLSSRAALIAVSKHLRQVAEAGPPFAK